MGRADRGPHTNRTPGGGLCARQEHKEVEQFLKMGSAPNPVRPPSACGGGAACGWFWLVDLV